MDDRECEDLCRAVVRQSERIISGARTRKVLAIILTLIGAVLLYQGLSDGQHFLTTSGIIFVLYALFMRFHVSKTQSIIKDLKRAGEQLAATTKKEDLRRALVRQSERALSRARTWTVMVIILLLAGGVLLYWGLSDGQHLLTTFGIIFVLYGLFMRFHVRKARTIIRELESEIDRLAGTHTDQDENTGQEKSASNRRR